MTASTLAPERKHALLEHLTAQSASCRRDGSPLCAMLLEAAAVDLEADRVVARLFADWEGHPMLDASSMRLLGALHGLVLAGRAPELARHYPTVGGAPDAGRLARDLFETLEAHQAEIRTRLDTQVQTNEVRRAVSLIGGFLHVADQTGLPLALHEFGASSGLLQQFDRYRYELGPHRFGDPSAALVLATDWSGPPPSLDAKLEIATRGACDLAPIDLEDPQARARLESFMWGDQPERLARLRSAIAIAREHGTRVERARAIEWLQRRLPARRTGAAHVVFHSSVWWYLPKAERVAVKTLIESEGTSATRDRPLAWLRIEGDNLDWADIRLRIWPGGDDLHLGRARYHGQAVEWQGT
jgi:hypothetical protein